MIAPVVLIIYRRPEATAAAIERLRLAAPPQIFVVADGPRASDDGDRELVHETRRALARIDWSCDLHLRAADQNRGCDRTIIEGLDWVFSRVPQAIIIEDDVVVPPAWLPFATDLLAAYAGDHSVAQIGAHNDLLQWPDAGRGYVRSRRGSIWGWATWRRAWQPYREWLSAATPPVALASDADPLLRLVYGHRCSLYQPGGPMLAWDTCWEIHRMMTGGCSLTTSTNVVRNIGFSPDATRTTDADSPSASQPMGVVPELCVDVDAPVDATFDRWSMLFDVIANLRRPDILAKLSRSRSLQLAPTEALHTAPFRYARDSVELIHHLRRHGLRHPRLDAVLAELSMSQEAQQ